MKKKTSITTGLAALLIIIFWSIFTNENPDQSMEPTPVITKETEEYAALSFRRDEQLTDHYAKHGIDMGYDSKEEYLAGANAVIANPDYLNNLEEEDGYNVYYLEETN